MRILVLLSGTLLALAACDSPADPESQAVDTPTPSPQDACGELNATSFQALADEITAQSVLNIQTVPATLSGWWLVGGEIEDPGLAADGEVAIWAVDEDPIDRLVDEFVAVNDVARTASNWGEAPEGVTEADPAVDVLEECVRDVG